MDVQRFFIFLCLLLSASAATAEAFQFSRTLSVDGHYEQCLKIEVGHSLAWQFGASQSLAFNLHSHRDDKTVYHLRNESRSDEGAFKAKHSGVYCVMWENKSKQSSDLAGVLAPGAD